MKEVTESNTERIIRRQRINGNMNKGWRTDGNARERMGMVSKWGSGCYGVDRRCGVTKVKGVAELLGYGVEWRSGVGGVQS